jgi:hypothetical protein
MKELKRKPVGSQGLMSVQETQGQAWVTVNESQTNRPPYFFFSYLARRRTRMFNARMMRPQYIILLVNMLLFCRYIYDEHITLAYIHVD